MHGFPPSQRTCLNLSLESRTDIYPYEIRKGNRHEPSNSDTQRMLSNPSQHPRNGNGALHSPVSSVSLGLVVGSSPLHVSE